MRKIIIITIVAALGMSACGGPSQEAKDACKDLFQSNPNASEKDREKCEKGFDEFVEKGAEGLRQMDKQDIEELNESIEKFNESVN